MAPSPRPPEGSVPGGPEYDEFIEKLRVYHEKRGTTFDPTPRVNMRLIDLKKLFDTVVEMGGYDKVAVIPKEWRRVGDIVLGLKPSGNQEIATDATAAFNLKKCYKNFLAAYEITTIHGQEPPPPEILEHSTAAGANLLQRTKENYNPKNKRESIRGTMAGASGDSADEGTPTRDRDASAEETPGSGRATRGLRQAPPQRQLFQPESTPRQTRQSQPLTSAAMTPRGASSSFNPSNNPDNMSFAVNNYEPRQQQPIPLRPAATPASDPAGFARRQRQQREPAASGGSSSAANPKIMLPGTGFDGPNIYVRCLNSLKSGIPNEQQYALHHLVKISKERGDKYKFESFPGLSDELILKVLEVSSLFYDVKWEISYMGEGLDKIEVLDGLNGTPDILKRIAELPRTPFNEAVMPGEFRNQLLMVNEAALTIRNMVLLEENAFYVSENYPLRDFLSIALNLPNYDCLGELKFYALEIAEQITKYMPSLDPEDPLYISLLANVQSEDRGAILTALRAISRISMKLEETNKIQGVPIDIIEKMSNWLLLEDEELLHASLDFLYQYTALVNNVNTLANSDLLSFLTSQLVRFLNHGSKPEEKVMSRTPDYIIPAKTEIPPLPSALMDALMNLEEPDRSSQWLRCIFEEDADESITQILLWQSYQSAFAQPLADRGLPMLAAAEFIKNVSSTFEDKASAQVQPGPIQKFIIKGIRIRQAPVDFAGVPYSPCPWSIPHSDPLLPPGNKTCGALHAGPQPMFDHILQAHLGAEKKDGKYPTVTAEYACLWPNCRKFPTPTSMKLTMICHHLKVHVCSLPKDSSELKPWVKPGVKHSFMFYNTPRDENNDPTGIPLTSALILTNLARTLPKTEANSKAVAQGKPQLVDWYFTSLESKLYDIIAYNRTMAFHVHQLLQKIREAKAS